MALKTLGIFPLLYFWGAAAGTNATARNIAASTHWIGGWFESPVTDTITEIQFVTSTATSPILELEAAITNLDANGFPLGSDIGVSSNSITNPSATTIYTLTASVSVTAGTAYGIILRVKSGTYTSGSINTRASWASDIWGGNPAIGYPKSSYNLGSGNVSIDGNTVLMVKYSSNGWKYTRGLAPFHPNSTGAEATGGAVDRAVGNKFTLNHTVKVWGYVCKIENDNAAGIALYNSTDGTKVSNSSVSLTSAYRTNAASRIQTVPLAAPVQLSPGTYRVALYNEGTLTNSVSYMSVPQNAQSLLGPGSANMMKTEWGGTTWTDTDTAVSFMSPLISEVSDGVAASSDFIPSAPIFLHPF